MRANIFYNSKYASTNLLESNNFLTLSWTRLNSFLTSFKWSSNYGSNVKRLGLIKFGRKTLNNVLWNWSM